MTGVRHLSSAPCRLVKTCSTTHQCRTLYVTALYTSTVHTSDRVLLQPMFFASSCDTFFLCRVKTVAMLITWPSRFKVVALYVWLTKYKNTRNEKTNNWTLSYAWFHLYNKNTFTSWIFKPSSRQDVPLFTQSSRLLFPAAAYVCRFRYLKHYKAERRENTDNKICIILDPRFCTVHWRNTKGQRFGWRVELGWCCLRRRPPH